MLDKSIRPFASTTFFRKKSLFKKVFQKSRPSKSHSGLASFWYSICFLTYKYIPILKWNELQMQLTSKHFSFRRYTYFRDFSSPVSYHATNEGLLCWCVTMVTSYPVRAVLERPPLVKYAVNSCTIVHLHILFDWSGFSGVPIGREKWIWIVLL